MVIVGNDFAAREMGPPRDPAARGEVALQAGVLVAVQSLGCVSSRALDQREGVGVPWRLLLSGVTR